jgi:hypothetical protein
MPGRRTLRPAHTISLRRAAFARHWIARYPFCEVYGLSLYYFYRGIDIGLRPDFAKLLSAMEKMSAGKRVGREGRRLEGR